MRSVVHHAGGILTWIERVFVFFAILSSAAMMAIVSLDTVLRYVFHAPLYWSIDVVSRYLMVASFYLAISYTFHHGGHIRVLSFRRMFGLRTKAIGDIVIYLAAGAIFSTIGLRMFSVMVGQWMSGEATIGVYFYPNWITSAFVSLGSLLLAFRVLLRAVERILDLLEGRDDVELAEEHVEEITE